MRITESQLRRIVREEIEAVDRNKKKLIVQDDEIGERGGYDIDRPAIPGGKGSHNSDIDLGMIYQEEGDDNGFAAVRKARFKASGMSDDEAEKMARSKLRHRGQRPGRG